jgi:hypothetical protein
MKQRLFVGSDGRRWCFGGARYHHRGVKRYYETIDEAWIDAFFTGARYHEVMMPYRCHPIIVMKTEVHVIPHPNPWAFRPWLSRIVVRYLKRRQCCGGYHLTRQHLHHLLPPGRGSH